MIYVARAPIESAPRGWIMYRAADPGADGWISFGRDARMTREWHYQVGRGRCGRGQASLKHPHRNEPTLLETVLAVASPNGDVVLWYGAAPSNNSLRPRALAIASIDMENSPRVQAEGVLGLGPEHPCNYWDKRIRGFRRARAAEHMRALHAKFAGKPLPPFLPADVPVGSARWIALEVAFAYLGGYRSGCLR
jgi:hypothetical protein